jgi:hypothetical protein
VSVTVIIVIAIVTMITALIMMIVAPTVIIVILVLTVMMAVVVPNFLAIFAGVEAPFPSAMATPVSMFASNRKWAVIAKARIVSAIDVASEADRAVEPRASSEEDASREPRWSVVTEGSAIIGRVVEVAVGASRLSADVNGDLYFGL